MVNSFSVLRDRPVKRQRWPGAGKRSHSGFTDSEGVATEGVERSAFMMTNSLRWWLVNTYTPRAIPAS